MARLAAPLVAAHNRDLPGSLTRVSVPVTIEDDEVFAPNERLAIGLQAPQQPGVQLGSTRSYALSIVDDDIPVIGFATAGTDLWEDGTLLSGSDRERTRAASTSS